MSIEEEEVDYSYSDCEQTVTISSKTMSEAPANQKTELELLREENNRLKELLKLQAIEKARSEGGPVLSNSEQVNVVKEMSLEMGTKAVSASNGIESISAQPGGEEHQANGLAGDDNEKSSNSTHPGPHPVESEGIVNSLTSAAAQVGESVWETGKKVLEQSIPPLLLDLPVIDPHPPKDPTPPHSPPRASIAEGTNVQDVNNKSVMSVVEGPQVASPMHIAEGNEQERLAEQHTPRVFLGHPSPAHVRNVDGLNTTDENELEVDPLGYNSATSATSPPFTVNEAIIFRAKENAARREGVQNVCPYFVHGNCAVGDACPLSHDTVPDTHCWAFNTTGQCFDEMCPLLHRLVEFIPAVVQVEKPVEEQSEGQAGQSVVVNGEGSDALPTAAQQSSDMASEVENSVPAEATKENIDAATTGAEALALIGIDETQVNHEPDRNRAAGDGENVLTPQDASEVGKSTHEITVPVVVNVPTSGPASAIITVDVDSPACQAPSVAAAIIDLTIPAAITATTTIVTSDSTRTIPQPKIGINKTPSSSRDSSFGQLLDTYQHHSSSGRSTSPPQAQTTYPASFMKASTKTSTATATPATHAITPSIANVLTTPVTVNVPSKPEEGEVCEKGNGRGNGAQVASVKKGKSRFDEDSSGHNASVNAAGAAATTTGSSVATLHLPSPRDGPISPSMLGSPTGGGARPSSGICYNYKRGACDRGDSCRFSHDLSSEPPISGVCYSFQSGKCDLGDQCRFQHVPPGICFNFRRGECDRGESCRFRHDARELCMPYQSGSCTQGDSCPRRHDNEVCRAFSRGGCSKGDACYYRHVQEECRDFQRGHCPRGETCHFSHGIGVANSSSGPPHPPSSVAASHPVERSERVGPGPCYAFLNGTCNLGDDCRYTHSSSIYGVAGVCNMFQRGECTKGDACKYKHELELCRAFQRGSCRNGDRCNYLHPSGNTASNSNSRRYDEHDGRGPQQPSLNHYQPPLIKRGRSFSRSPSRGREEVSRSKQRHRDSESRDRADNRDNRAPKLAKRDRSPPASRSVTNTLSSRSAPRDPPRYHSDHDYDRRTGFPSSHTSRPVPASTTASISISTSRFEGPPPVEEAICGEADAATQRRARENELRRSTIANPCPKAYAGKCQLGDSCAFSHDVIPYAYCRLYNNAGYCHKKGCPYIHELYQYRPTSDGNRSQQGSSHRGRSPSPSTISRNASGGSGYNKYGRASPSPPRHYSAKLQSQSQAQSYKQVGSQKRTRSPSLSPSPPPDRRRRSRSPPRARHSPPRTDNNHSQYRQQAEKAYHGGSWARGERYSNSNNNGGGSHYQNNNYH